MVMWILDGTKYDLGDAIEEGIFASFFECQQWLYRYTTVEPSTIGRFIDSGTRDITIRQIFIYVIGRVLVNIRSLFLLIFV